MSPPWSRRALLLPLAAVAALTCACGDDDGSGDYDWNLPAGFPEPKVPADNPMSAARVELGRHLFYDTRLSGNQTYSCASCHEQARAFSDGRATALGSTGELHFRNSMSLVNLAYYTTYTWANPVVVTLERQALGPMFGEMPVELGLANLEEELLARLAADPLYQQLFADAFPDEADPFSIDNVTKALACFERTLISGDAPFDRFSRGDSGAMSESAKRGMELFFSERLECHHCHGGFNFTQAVTWKGKASDDQFFQNDGLYNLDGAGAYPPIDPGLMAVTDDPADMGKFRAPTLRNVAVSAPYMHDGSIATLEEVVEHYARGGRLIESGPNAGDGAQSPLKSSFLTGFQLTPEEVDDLVAFLEALTDETFLTDPRFASPFE